MSRRNRSRQTQRLEGGVEGQVAVAESEAEPEVEATEAEVQVETVEVPPDPQVVSEAFEQAETVNCDYCGSDVLTDQIYSDRHGNTLCKTCADKDVFSA